MSQEHKLCECGCGEVTNFAPYTNKTIGYIKNMPLRFILGHNLKIHHFTPWGDLNVNWKGDNVVANSGRNRTIKRFKIDKCEICSKQAIDRHHKDGNTLNYKKDNIQFLCRRCHMIIDGRLKKFNRYIKI